MSSYVRGAWKVPQYRVAALSPLLLNESLGAADPHGSGSHSQTLAVDPHGIANHTDRTVDILFTADRFQSAVGGTFENVNTLPVWRCANAVDTQLVGNLEIDQRLVATGQILLDTVLFVRPGGVVAAGNAQIGLTLDWYGDGNAINSLVGVPGAVAIGAEVASPVLLELAVPAVSVGGAVRRILHVLVQRDASLAGDTFEDILYFAGLVATFTLDQ